MVLQFSQGVTGRPVGVPSNCALQVKVAGIAVGGVRGPDIGAGVIVEVLGQPLLGGSGGVAQT